MIPASLRIFVCVQPQCGVAGGNEVLDEGFDLVHEVGDGCGLPGMLV